MVALAEAWRSGAPTWSTSKREDFANDLTSQQLIAVSGESNMEKSDEDPVEWKPSNTGYRCMYARSWINVKYVWNLSVNRAEKTALSTMLDSCCHPAPNRHSWVRWVWCITRSPRRLLWDMSDEELEAVLRAVVQVIDPVPGWVIARLRTPR